jgi:uncharacterized membrane protein YebE (DUF533 family)
MFNAEQLLGKMMSGMVGSDSGYGYKKHKRHKSGDMISSLTSTLMSGKGLITAIGLGVGAYEILKSSQGTAASASTTFSQPLVSPPPINQGAGSSAPMATVAPPPLPGGSAPPRQEGSSPAVHDDELALRLIQVMIAASHADGVMDSDEEGKILARLQGQGISQEEKQFVLAEMHDPKPIEYLAAGIKDQRVAQTMYSLAVSAVVVDTAQERAWLDQLGTALSVSEGMRRFIEGQD